MEKLLPALILIFIYASAHAQTTVTDASFPAAGDTLKTATDLSPQGIEITAAGGPYDWDFSGLDANALQRIAYRPASEGNVAAEVPLANLVAFNEETQAETYFQVNNETVGLIAVNGNDPIGAGLQAIFRFTPPIVERRAPMTFPSNHTSTSNLLIAFAFSDLPPVVTDSLPLPLEPDSIRVRVTNERNDFVDAYGTLTIPGGSYDVLREKRTNFRETRVEILVPIFGWQDVTDLLIAGAPFEGLGMDTTITYNFFSDNSKEPVAVATMDNTEDNVTAVTFKDNGVVSGSEYLIDESTSIRIIPNPIRNDAMFEFHGFEPGSYRIGIVDLRGQIIHQRQLQIAEAQHTMIDLSHLAPGYYFYQLFNVEGTLLATGKLVKL